MTHDKRTPLCDVAEFTCEPMPISGFEAMDFARSLERKLNATRYNLIIANDTITSLKKDIEALPCDCPDEVLDQSKETRTVYCAVCQLKQRLNT